MIHDPSEIPEGYEIEWRVDTEWEVGGNGRQCRSNFGVGPLRHRCPNLAVARLFRGFGDKWTRPWAYCAEHMYGREIRDGRVMIDCLREADALAEKEGKAK